MGVGRRHGLSNQISPHRALGCCGASETGWTPHPQPQLDSRTGAPETDLGSNLAPADQGSLLPLGLERHSHLLAAVFLSTLVTSWLVSWLPACQHPPTPDSSGGHRTLATGDSLL